MVLIILPFRDFFYTVSTTTTIMEGTQTMLTLTRRIGEKIIIQDNIVCTVLDVQDKYIRLGFIAPADVVIHRQEMTQQPEALEKKLAPTACLLEKGSV